MTPEQFYAENLNKVVDVDGYPKGQPYQCIDGFRWWGRCNSVPVPATPDDRASGYWTCKNAKGETPGAHGRLRMVRKTAAGTYLVCCAGASMVREYDKAGKLIWEQSVPVLAFDVLRRANGNTLIGHVSGVTEYTPDHKVAWEFKGDDVPSLKLACLCGVQELADGNIVVGSWANGEPDGSKATACEINRDKKIVWAWFPKSDANMMSAFRLD